MFSLSFIWYLAGKHLSFSLKNGGADLKHPDNADAYTGGHLNEYLPDCHIEHVEWSDSDDNV
jgi:hypothetical protein